MINPYHFKPRPIILLAKDEEKSMSLEHQEACKRWIRDGVKPVYHTRPVAPLAIGMELEIELVKNPLAETAARVSDEFDKDAAELLVYYKTDSSLQNGFEIVSHPRTLKSWFEIKNKLKDYMKKLRVRGFRSYDTGRCGMHFHINRSAFISPLHIAKFIRFWEENHEMSFAISRRNVNSMARYAHLQTHLAESAAAVLYDAQSRHRKIYGLSSVAEHAQVNLPHHSAVAITDNTVEVRIFRGTMNVNTILSTMELCSKLVSITMNISAANLSVEAVKKFIPDNKKNKRLIKILSMKKDVTRSKISQKRDLHGGSSRYLSTKEQLMAMLKRNQGMRDATDKAMLAKWIGLTNEKEMGRIAITKGEEKKKPKTNPLIGLEYAQVARLVGRAATILWDGRMPNINTEVDAIYNRNLEQVPETTARMIREWHLDGIATRTPVPTLTAVEFDAAINRLRATNTINPLPQTAMNNLEVALNFGDTMPNPDIITDHWTRMNFAAPTFIGAQGQRVPVFTRITGATPIQRGGA